jgi:alpha-1,3-glucosyltransferase
MACIASLRTTVIISDTVLWFSAYVILRVIRFPPLYSTNDTNDARKQVFANLLLFGLLVFHPALLWLDHVHFQYNGCLMGILMLSLACLMHANNIHQQQKREDALLHCMAAVLFAILLTLKHLYLTCCLWYLVYLLRRNCFDEKSFYSGIQRFLLLAIVSAAAFAMPFLVFFLSLEKEDRYDWIIQVFKRLFPFQRGLVHDYWAGNIWALYVAIIKVTRFLLLPFLNDAGMEFLRWLERDAVTPGVSGLCLLIGQLPGLRLAILAAARRSNVLLLQSFVYVTLASFLFQYHAHEKAIITALFPATIWASLTFQSKDDFNAFGVVSASSIGMFLQVFTTLAILGLFPLLFRPQELLFKVTSCVGFLAALQYFVSSYVENQLRSGRNRRVCIALYYVVAMTAVQLDVLPVGHIFGKYEFAPLAITSLVCAVGNLFLFAQVLIWTMRATAKYA